MPGEERTRGAERCSVHGSSPAVATCDGCGRPMCLSCAIPVRGRTLGAECVAAVLGREAAPAPTPHQREPGALAQMIARAAFGVSALATVLPWSRFGPGSQAFGAWSTQARWSTVAAIAAVAGLGLSVLRPLLTGSGRSWDAVAVAAGALAGLGSVLALLRPPAFASPWLGPWVSLGAALVAVGSCSVALRRVRRGEPAHV